MDESKTVITIKSDGAPHEYKCTKCGNISIYTYIPKRYECSRCSRCAVKKDSELTVSITIKHEITADWLNGA